MRIDSTTWTGSPDWRVRSQGNSPAGMLIPLGPVEDRKGHAPPSPDAADAFIVVHDRVHGEVVIDLYHAATRYDEPPTYRLTGEGGIEVGKKPRKGGIVDLLA